MESFWNERHGTSSHWRASELSMALRNVVSLHIFNAVNIDPDMLGSKSIYLILLVGAITEMALLASNHRSQHMQLSDELQHVLCEEPKRCCQVSCTIYWSMQDIWDNLTREMETLR